MNTVTYLGVFAAAGMLIFPGQCAYAARQSLILCAKTVIPSLFPYFICINLILNSGLAERIGRRTGFLMRPLFNVPGEGAFVFAAGIFCGYPTGAKCTADLLKNGCCTKSEAQRMVNFCNNSGPAFILGSVGASMLGSANAGVILLTAHVLAAITLGIIQGRGKKAEKTDVTHRPKACKASLADSVRDSVNLILYVCGYIVFFNIIVSLARSFGIFSPLCKLLTPTGASLDGANAFLCGIIEMTGGISRLAAANTVTPKLILISFLLGFGGISVIMQIHGIISEYGLSLKSFVFAKLSQAVISVIYTALLLRLPLSVKTSCTQFSAAGSLSVTAILLVLSIIFSYAVCETFSVLKKLLHSCKNRDIIN